MATLRCCNNTCGKYNVDVKGPNIFITHCEECSCELFIASHSDPKPATIKRPAEQIQSPEKRAKVRKLLGELWGAMGLKGHGCGIVLPEADNLVYHEQLFWFFGKTLLGEECPGGEKYT